MSRDANEPERWHISCLLPDVPPKPPEPPASFWRRNALSLAFCGLTLFSLLGHVLAGRAAENHERLQSGLPGLDFLQYLRSGVFLSSLFENWESEFLQMTLFVLLTVWLKQKGSSESKPLEETSPEATTALSDSPWPVRTGGIWLRLYEHSLSFAFGALCVMSFVGHWLGSYRHHVEKATREGQAVEHGLWHHLVDSEFWFESFQNWQSEFFSISVLVLLSIYLREKDSAQSKEVRAPHSQTGG